MRAFLLLLLAMVGGCGGCASLPPNKVGYGSALRIEFADGLCSGTAVARHTVLSAAHCFVDQAHGVAKINGTLSEYVVVADDGRDHVLVRVGVTLPRVAKIGKPPRWGQMLSMIGNPLGYYSLLRMGRVAGWDKDAQCPDKSPGCTMVLADLETAGGDSGAGYFNARGEVVGVHSGMMFKDIWRLAYSYPLAFTPEQYAEMV